MELIDRLAEAERRLGYEFTDRSLLEMAFIHSSATEERAESNERLEFLGDAILGTVICEDLFRRFPDMFEGELTKIKSNVVSRKTCAELAQELDLAPLLVLGKGMDGRGEIPPSLKAAVFEAVIGAMYLDSGLGPTRDFICRLLDERIVEAARLGHQHNFKSVLQQVFQRKGFGPPTYAVLDEQGPDHAKCFEVCVESGLRRFEGCWGSNKKQAEQQAALAALFKLGLAAHDEQGDIQLSPDCWTDDPLDATG
jgi:ribonuclease-3